MAAYIPTLGTILVAIFGAVWGIYSYRQQKRIDRENYVAQKQIDREDYAAEKETERKIELRNRRMKEYERYLTAYRTYISLYDFDPPPADNSKAVIEAVNEYWLAYGNLFHIASDPVLMAVSDFHNWAWIENPPLTNETVKKFNDLYAKMIITMREDVSERTELSLEEVKNRLPFNFAPREDTKSETAKGEQTE
jgi:hypothetical protein